MIDLEQLRTAYHLIPPLALYPLPGGVNNAVVGLQTGGGDFVIKTLQAPHDPATLSHELAVVQWLATQGLPFTVPTPVVTRTGQQWLAIASPTHEGDEWRQLLLPRIAGHPPDWREPAQMERVGAALAALHGRLAHYPTSNAAAHIPYGALTQIHPRIPDPFTLAPADLGLPATPRHAAALAWWRAELAALRAFIDGPYRALPWQMIHGDFGPGNTLYTAVDGQISAVLDFEFAGPDARALDVAAGLYFCMRIWENPTPLVNATAFWRGYERIQRLTPAELDALPWLIRLRNAVSTLWWFGRALATRASVEDLSRIDQMQAMVTWLAQNAAPFRAVLQSGGVTP